MPQNRWVLETWFKVFQRPKRVSSFTPSSLALVPGQCYDTCCICAVLRQISLICIAGVELTAFVFTVQSGALKRDKSENADADNIVVVFG